MAIYTGDAAYKSELNEAYASKYPVDSAPTIQRSPVETVEWSMGLTQDLCYRVEAMVSRLCGGGTASGNSEKSTAPSGIFPSLQERAESTAATVRWAMEALDRLERQLS